MIPAFVGPAGPPRGPAGYLDHDPDRKIQIMTLFDDHRPGSRRSSVITSYYVDDQLYQMTPSDRRWLSEGGRTFWSDRLSLRTQLVTGGIP